VSVPTERIIKLQSSVTARMRWQNAQDGLAVVALLGGLSSAAATLYIRLKPLPLATWTICVAVFAFWAVVVVILLARRRHTRRDTALLIDGKLAMEDRFASAASLIEKGGPEHVFESALIEDTSERLKGAKADSIIPLRLRRWYAVSLLAVGVLVGAIVVPERSLPGGKALLEARADVQQAGETLEEGNVEVQKLAGTNTPTSELAREQADLGSSLRRGSDTRAQALKKLSALGERIRTRHTELAATRADEIVSLAEKRLGNQLPSSTTARRAKPSRESDSSEPAVDEAQSKSTSEGEPERDSSQAKSVGPDVEKTAAGRTQKQSSAGSRPVASPRKGDQARTQREGPGQAAPEPAAPAGGDQTGSRKEAAQSPSVDRGAPDPSKQPPRPNEVGQPTTPSVSPPAGDQENKASTENRAADKSSSETGNAASPLTGAIAEQAAKAMPALSEQLLKQADQLRLDKLSPEDIARLAKSAEALVRDLAPIAQSEEFKKSLEQLSKQVNPEALERVAEELMKQEGLRRELEASVRLLAQNRQAREIAAGLARSFGGDQEKKGDQANRGEMNQARRGAGDRPPDGDRSSSGLEKPSSSNGGGSGAGTANVPVGLQAQARNRIKGGAETALQGKVESGRGGEYLYLTTRAEKGAARMPYVSAYPRYRREAEKSVQRSRIPPRMRSVVRDYFDAINPEGKK
jgi:hypothetical protein